MEQLLDRPSTYEQRSDSGERLNRDKVVYLGNLAIRWEVLGINDPLTHLYQFLERGDAALIGIIEDLLTDVGERLPKTPFVNHVTFEFTGDDFVSKKDHVSMKSMTENNLLFYEAELKFGSSRMSDEHARAVVESQEAAKLAEWFIDAKNDSFLVFESLPIGSQEIAISRVFQKKADGTLESSFISLHNPSVGHFNELRSQMVPGTAPCSTELEVLSNQYEFRHHDVTTSEDFVDYYVGVYDHLAFEKDGKSRSFGIEVDERRDISDGLAKIRSQPGLISVYVDILKALVDGRGIINDELLKINSGLGLGFGLIEGQRLSIQMARGMLSKVITGIVSVIDRASDKQLVNLASDSGQGGSSYDAVSNYGGEASAAGETYASGGCQTASRSSTEGEQANGSTKNKVKQAYRGKDALDDFGETSFGVCRVKNCISHGENKYIYNKTKVGGCSICVRCHLLFKQKKSPEHTYDAIRRDEEKRKKSRMAYNDIQKDGANQKSKIHNKPIVMRREESTRPPKSQIKPKFDLWSKKPEKPNLAKRPK